MPAAFVDPGHQKGPPAGGPSGTHALLGLPAGRRRQLLPFDVVQILAPAPFHELDDRGDDRSDERELQVLA